MRLQEAQAATNAANQKLTQTAQRTGGSVYKHDQAAWSKLLSQAHQSVEKAAHAGKNYTEVTVKDREAYRNLAGHFEAEGYRCNPEGDGQTNMVCVVRW